MVAICPPQPIPLHDGRYVDDVTIFLTSPDPWQLLDPHDSGAAKIRPFKRGKTHRQPRSLEKDAGGKAVKKVEVEIWSHQRRSLKLPYFADFSSAYLVERNRLLALKLAAARTRKASVQSNPLLKNVGAIDLEVSCCRPQLQI